MKRNILSSCIHSNSLWLLLAFSAFSFPVPVPIRPSSAKPCEVLPSEWGTPISFSLSPPKQNGAEKNRKSTAPPFVLEKEQQPAQCLCGGAAPSSPWCRACSENQYVNARSSIRDRDAASNAIALAIRRCRKCNSFWRLPPPLASPTAQMVSEQRAKLERWK